MLLEKSIATGTVVTIKLSSSEEVIAEYHSETSDHILVNDPVTLAQHPQTGDISPFPWLMTSEQTTGTPINKSHISVITVSREDVAKMHLQSTTKIALPS